MFGQVGNDLAKDVLNESIGERKLAVCAHTKVGGNLQGKPTFHALALNDDSDF
jgi:hypothetical protein